jgi:uncharacterized protein
MKPRAHDPLRLDVAAAAAEGTSLTGRWPLATLERLHTAGDGDLACDWQAQFEQRRVAGERAPQVWLRLSAQTQVARDCQRCLQPVLLPLAVDRAFRFVPTEDEAAALDADSDDDVLALSGRFDLRALVEDELLLALPLVPKHDQCPTPWQPVPPEAEPPAEHPFAALAALRRTRG